MSDVPEGQHRQEIPHGRTGRIPRDRTAARAPGQQEYRLQELALAAGVKVRDLRHFQERGLLPPPRREGGIAWYSQDHLARLRLISDLLERGYTVGGLTELLFAWERGRPVAELLGLERAMTHGWPQEEPVRLGLDELRSLFGHEATGANLRRAVELGYLTVDGDTATHVSRRLLEAALALVGEGVPLAAVLAAGDFAQRRTADLADRFAALLRTHVIGPSGPGELPPGELPAARMRRIAEAVDRLRPVAGTVVDAEFARAMERRVRAELEELLGARPPQPHQKPSPAPGHLSPHEPSPAPARPTPHEPSRAPGPPPPREP